MSRTHTDLLAGRFELEQLESRVLLSADILAASASLAGAAHAASEHKIFAAHETISSVTHSTEHSAYNPSDKVGGLFEGMNGEAVASTSHHESAAQTESKAVVASQAPASESHQTVTETATTTASQQAQEQRQSATRTASTTVQPSVPQTISATATTGASGASVMTQQLTKTLKTANSPPATTGTSNAHPQTPPTDFQTYVQGILNGQSGSYNATVPVSGSLSIGSFLQINGVSLTFAATENNNVWSGSVTISATSGGVFVGQNYSATTGSISGTYYIGTVPQNKHQFDTLVVHNLNLNIGQALTITSTQLTVNYDSSAGATQTIATITNATATSPLLSGFGVSGTLTNFTLRPNGFSFGNFTLSSTSPVTIGNFFTATSNSASSPVSLSVSDFNLNFSDAKNSTGSVTFSADNVQLFPGVGFLNLNFGSLHGTFDIIDTNTTTSVSTIGSAVFSLSISNLNVSIGDALTIHMGDVVVTPGQATVASVTDATVTSNLLGGFGTFSLGAFALTQHGFSLTNFSLTPTGTAVTIGNFASFSSPSFNVNSFTLNDGAVTGSITFSGNLTIFPNNANVSSSFTNLQAHFDFSSANKTGALTFTADSFTMTVDNQLTVTAGSITLSPDSATILQVDSFSVTLAQLGALAGTQLTGTGLKITSTGFTLDSASFQASNTSFNLGGVVAFSAAPNFTFSNIAYTIGGSIGGTVTLNPTTITLSLGGAITASGTLSGDYNLRTGTLNAAIDSFSLNLAGFVSVSGSGLVVAYQPSTDGSAQFLIGGTGLTVLMGNGSGSNAVGVEVTNATFALGVFKAASPSTTITYALDASGGISIVGLPGSPVNFSAANVDVRVNTAGSVDKMVNVDSNPADAVRLLFTGNQQSFMASGLTLTVSNLVSITGDFGFQAFTDPTSSLTDVAIGAANVNATLGTGTTNLTITGASLGLLILPGSTTNTYALVASGGMEALNGVPGLSLSVNGLTVKVNTTGLDSTALAALMPSVLTPDGAASPSFAGFDGTNVLSVEGSISLNIAGFISLSGDFGFQTFNNNQDIIVGAENVTATVGTATTYLSINGASLQLAIAPGTSGGYALLVNGGTDTLVGVPGLSLSASNLSVKINTLNANPSTLGLPTSVSTPGGDINVTLSSLGSSNIKDIEGDLTLTVANFVTLQGSFGFQAFTDSNSGLTDIAIGATGLTATLGTSNLNLQVTGASLGVLVIAGSGTNASTYALVANGGTDTLNGIPGVSLVGNGLSVKINNLGVDPSTLPGIPTSVHTSGGDVPLDFSGMGSGALKDVEGTITLSVLNFVNLQGSFAFQSFTDLVSGATDLAVAATNVNATLAVGGVSLTINGASLGLILLPGASANSSTYALVANGGTDALTGIPGLSLSASGLSVRINNTGVDPSTRLGSTSISTPGGSVSLDFTGLGTGNVKDIEGSITLTISNFVSLSGDFGFQQFTDTATSTSEILVGGKNINATLGTSTTNVSITGASLALLLLPAANGNPATYALMANGGTDALNGVPGLTLSTSGLMVQVNNSVSSTLLADAAQVVHTSGGDVTLNFSNLGSGNVINVEGAVSLNVAGFVSLSGTFVFTKQLDPTNSNISEIVVAATGVNAFLGTADQKVGVAINNANLGLVVFQDLTGHTTTYALQASAGVQVVGLPTDIGFSGTIGVEINTTGAAVDQTVTTANGSVHINFTDGTGGNPDQRNIEQFSGSLTLSIGPQSSPLFTLSGDFAFTKTVVSGTTELLIGATNIATSNLVPDNNGGASVTISGGTLGLIIFTKASGGTTVNAGYALTASATVTAGGGGASGTVTVTIRRNTTTTAVNQTVSAGGGTVQVTFSSTEVASGTKAFQSIALSNASLSIDNTIIITAGSGASTSSGGVTTVTLTGVTLTLQDPTSGTVLFSVTAASASYSTVNAGVTFDGIKWVNGGKDVVLTNISLSIGGYVTFTGTVDIQHYTNASNAVITSFNFSSASVTFLVNSQPMVTVAGTFAFSYSSASGFSLSNATITNFSFLGQSLGGASANTVSTSSATPAAGSTHTLGPITLGTPSISLSNFSLHLDGTLSVTVTISDPLASISGSVISAEAHNLSGSFNIGLKLNLANPLSVPTNITASGFTLSIGELDITLNASSNVSLVLTAHDVTIDPTAGPTADLVSFGGTTAAPGLSATLTVASFQFTGGASNFAITGNGSFVAGNNFSVTLGFGASTTSDALSWPSWLPIHDVSISLTWTNFNTDPSNFLLDLSASIDIDSIGGIPLSFHGSVSHLVIDTGKLAAGQFPIVSIGSLGVSVTGNLFGGTVSGTLIAGIVRFDSTGAVVDANGNLVSNGTPGVGPFQSVFYAGIDASFSLGNMSGFEIRIGLTQYGPLSVYIEGSVPGGIILDPQSGLAINDFRGGVTFGQGIPTVNISNPISATDALQLRQNGFTPPAQLTLEEWQTQLASQVATLYSGGNATSGWSNLGASTITFQAGATLYDAYATQNAFKVDADIFFDTSGKFLVIGTATFANSLTLGVKLYADLSPIFNGTESTNPVNILFLMDFPSQGSTVTSTPILSIYGVLQFAFPNGGFQINIAGEADLNVMGGFKASLVGNLSLTFTATSFQMTISDVSLNVSYLGTIGQAAGSLTIQKDNGTLDIWGAFLLTTSLPALQQVGINVGGQIYFSLNTTNQVQPVGLQTTGGNISLNLQPESFSLLVTGTATFDLSGTQVFELSGTLAINLNIDTTTPDPTFTLTIFVSAELILGPANSSLFTFNANGLIFVDQNGFAAKMTLSYLSSPLSGFSISENWLLVMNTTGETISYQIPTPIPTSPPTPPIPTVMGPDFSSADVTALISYETAGPNGQRLLVIPDGAPPTGTTNFVNWTANSPSAYVILLGRGNLTIGSLTISGSLNIVASYSSVSGLSFSLEVNAKLNLTVNGSNLFSFSVTGYIQVSSSGLVAALNISLASGFSMPSGLGFTLSASFTLEINTTSGPVAVPGTGITVQPGALVAAFGSLSIPGFSITGEFDLTVSSSNLLVHVAATVNVLGVTFSVNGFAGIYYDNDPGFALSLTLSIGSSNSATLYPVSSLGNSFTIQGTFLLQINTCSQTRVFVNPVDNSQTSIASGFVISVSGLKVYLFGLNLTGNAYFGITSGGLNINLSLTLSFFGMSFSFDGYVNSDGSFSITASASFEYDWSIGIFSGEVYAYMSITLSNSGFAASAGCGIHVDGIGSLSAHADVYISGSEFKMDVGVDIGICDVTVTIDLGSKSDPPAPPPTPVLATQVGSTLYLNLGADVTNRGGSFGPVANEDYVLTGNGGDITVTALGYSQTFTGITDVEVKNTYNASTQTVAINVASGITATEHITLGSVNNTITTGGGYATIYDYGTGSNTINAGSGGGIYYGGLANGAAYGGKGETVINANNNFTVDEAGYASYVLSQSQLEYGSFLLDLTGINTVVLEAPVDTAAHTFTILGYAGTLTVNGQGSNNTINVDPQGGTSAATFVLATNLLQVTVGSTTSNYNLSDVQTANLTGDAKGANTFDVTNWTGGGSLTGPNGSTNTVIATNNRNFTLTDISLARSGLPTLTLKNIQNATLTGGISANIFNILNWSGNAILNGVGGNETFNITLNGNTAGTITVSDSSTKSSDILNLNTAASTTITSTQLTVASQLVNYSQIKTLNVSGTKAGLTYNVQSTNSTTTTTITTNGSGNVFNVGSTAGINPVSAGTLDNILGALVLVSQGADTLNVDDTANTTGRTGVLTATTLNVTGLATITFSGLSGITISLGQGSDSLTVVDTMTTAASVPVITINGDGGDDTFNVLATHAQTTINGGDGNDTFYVFGNSSALNVNGNAGNNVFNVFASVINGQQSYQSNALLTIDGGTGAEALNIFGTALNDAITIDQTTFTSIGLDVSFSNVANWTVYGLGGDDTFYVQSVVVNTTLVGDGSLPAFALPTGVATPNLDGGVTATSFNDTFYIGWRGQSVAGSLSGIAAPLTIQGNGGTNAAFVDDSANTAAQTFTLTPTTMTSTAMGANGQITYSGLATLNVLFGSGNDTLVLNDMSNTTATTIDGGLGNNSTTLTFSGDFAAANLTLLNFQTGSLNVTGNFTGSLTDEGAFTTISIGGSFTSTAVFNAGSIDTLTIGGDLAGLLNVTGAIGTATIDGSLTSTGIVNAASIGSMTIDTDLAGLLNVTGAFPTLSVHGAVTSTGIVNAASMDSVTIGGDFAGLLNVTNLLNTVAINGGAPGKIVAGDINFITVKSGYGNKVLQVIEGGVERQIQAVPVDGGTLDPSIRFAFIYDSSGPGAPQLAISITNSGTVTPHSFNLTLAVIGSNAKFNLALAVASAATGLSNLTVSGNILFASNANELNFLGLTTGVGVVLPFDNITGVEVSGILPIGEVNVAGIEGVAFGLLENSKGQVVPILGDLGSASKPQVLWNLLGSHATLLAATDTLTVTFNENQPIKVFAQVNSDFTLDYVMTLADQLNDGLPISASIHIAPGKTPVITNIAFNGDGASIVSRFSVANITSTGSLGDLTVQGSFLGNVTASAIFGNINVLAGAITGTIQTTGIRIDSVTGAQSAVSGDIGQFTYSSKTGAINGVTTISAKLGISGQIISRGDLMSSVKTGAFSGVIAAQGDIGTVTNAAPGALMRFGGITISGADSGQIIALGNAFGDITINGIFSGRIGVEGQPVAGIAADRDGILGNLRISKFATTGGVVSGGLIGDAAGGTTFKSSPVTTGFIGADGNINFAKGTKVTGPFPNAAGTASGAAIDSIFTNNGLGLQFDTGGPLAGLLLIESDLSNLSSAGGLLNGSTP